MFQKLRFGLIAAVLTAAVAAGLVSNPDAVTGATLPASPDCGAYAGAVDHAVYDSLLKRHVANDGRVDYDAFAASTSFQAYLEGLDCATVSSLSEPERLALWINAYNAYTIELINKHDERESIRNINKTLGLIKSFGPWREEIARVGGSVYTLDEIEHEIIRKEFDEPRIHFALVCAAVSCPPLRREAYTGERLDEQLHDQGMRFLTRSPDENRVDVGSRTVYLSSIFKWYREDFPDGNAALGTYLAGFHPPGDSKDLLLSGDFRIEHTRYDWSLNAQ